MLKIFTTQLVGRLKKIEADEEFNLEDGARLLAQALIGDGHIYLYAPDEFYGVFVEASSGQEPLTGVHLLTEENRGSLTSADRVLVFSRHADDLEAIALASQLAERMIPFVAISSRSRTDGDESLVDVADVFIDLKMERGLVPIEDGSRVGYPYLICALYVFHNMKILMDEIMEDY
ncbi:DUF2529 family protein [Bacillus kwashiorkori]|uniref:DUF2529 family protein n=1 Tax=Bacillus kwashiorkori TaxID=1522318 RepID=UPI0007839D32|nr:DUF2529 family protein [Bacillus kwashiorkori]